jgi:hypothetical protein
MAIAENISHWYDERKRSENPAQWANENPESAAALTTAHRLALEYKLLKD